MNRAEYVVIYDVTNSNPNGDPDAANQPRMHDNGFGYITDVCIKRKLRNVAAEDGQKILIASGENIQEACKGDVSEYWDVRMFGAVVTEKNSTVNRSVRGPIQFGFATSICPINPVQVCITSSVGRKENQTQTMGNKWIIPHAVYRQEIYFNANLAEKVGVSQSDVEKFEQYLINMMEFDRSAARPQMTVRGLYRIDHESKIGFAPSWETTQAIQIKNLVNPSASWQDYAITVQGNHMSTGEHVEFRKGVKITRLV